jgi:hypothetical protein
MVVLAAERALPLLQAGQRIHVSYATVEQLAVYDFTLMAAGTESAQMREIQVEPNSWLLRRLVHPMQIYFDQDGVLSRVRGQVLPMMGTPARRQPLEADARVLRHERHVCSAQPSADDPLQWPSAFVAAG